MLRGNEYCCRVRFFIYNFLFTFTVVCLQFDIYLFFLSSAMFLHNQLLGEPPTIDDKLVAVSYYRPPIGKLNFSYISISRKNYICKKFFFKFGRSFSNCYQTVFSSTSNINLDVELINLRIGEGVRGGGVGTRGG